MAVNWKLKTYLVTQHGIFSAVELQKKITASTGILISVQNLRSYLNKKPKQIPLKTIELICTSLQCKLSAFCEVTPQPLSAARKNQPKKLAFHNTPLKKRVSGQLFPDPNNYGD